jgi:hypothetical protein
MKNYETIGDLKERDDLMLVTDSQDIEPLNILAGFEPTDIDHGYFVKVENGEYKEVYEFGGIIPHDHKMIVRVI